MVVHEERFVREIREIHKALAASDMLETVPRLAVGKRVQIVAGPFRGIEGVVAELKHGLRVMLNATLIRRSVPLDVDARDVEPVN